MELVLLLSLLLTTPTIARPLPLTTASCNFPAPVVPSLSRRIPSCSSAELARQRQADYDEASVRWLEAAGIASHRDERPADSTESLNYLIAQNVAKAQASALPSTVVSQPSSEDEALPSLAELFTSGAAHGEVRERPRYPGKVTDEDAVEASMFDLPGARESTRTQGRRVLGAAQRMVHQGADGARYTIDQTAAATPVLMGFGVFLAAALMVRFVQLLLKCGRSVGWVRGSRVRLRDDDGGWAILAEPVHRRVKSSFEILRCGGDEEKMWAKKEDLGIIVEEKEVC